MYLFEKLQSVFLRIKRKYLLLGLLFFFFLLFPPFFFAGVRNSILQKTPVPTPTSLPKQQTAIPKDATYAQHQLIIKYNDGFAPDQPRYSTVKTLIDRSVISQKKLYNTEDNTLRQYYVLELKSTVGVKTFHDELEKIQGIENAAPNYYLQAQEFPNDPYYTRMWNLSKIQMPKAWEVTKGSDAVTVAVIDTGIDYTHPDFTGRTIIKGKDFSTCAKYSRDDEGKPKECIQTKAQDDDPMDYHGHGTHVAGIIGAMTDNSLGISAIAPSVKLLAVEGLGPDGAGEVSDVFQAMQYAADQKPQVMNLSLGGPGMCPQVMQDVINYVRNKGVIIVAAAGNDGKEATTFFPESCQGVISVSASDETDGRASFSNWGNTITIAAPGTNIISLYPTAIGSFNGFAAESGTSMASPHVAAAVALLLAKNPSLPFDQVKTCLQDGGDTINTDLPIGKRLNVSKTLKLCSDTHPSPTTSVTPSPSASLSATPNPCLAEQSFSTQGKKKDKAGDSKKYKKGPNPRDDTGNSRTRPGDDNNSDDDPNKKKGGTKQPTATPKSANPQPTATPANRPTATPKPSGQPTGEQPRQTPTPTVPPCSSPTPSGITPTREPTAIPTPTSPPPSAPRDLVAFCGQTQDPRRPYGIAFTWEPVNGAVGYAIRVDENPVSWNGDTANAGDTIINDLTQPAYERVAKPNTTYKWWVHAINKAGIYSAAVEHSLTCPSLTPKAGAQSAQQDSRIGAGRLIILPKMRQ